MKILQLGKFYPIRGGVEKVMWDLTKGLSQAGVACDMLCAKLPGDGIDPKDESLYHRDGYLEFPGGGKVWLVPALAKKAATMISPAMIRWLRKHQSEYSIIHIHHPDPMAALALRVSGFRGKVILHWHSDILSQKALLRLYRPLQDWLIGRADRIVGTTPVYVKESPWLQKVQDKCTFVPIGIEPVFPDEKGSRKICERFAGKTLLLSVGRLVPYKGFQYLVEAMKQLPGDCVLMLVGEGPLRSPLEEKVASEGLDGRVVFTGRLSDQEVADCFGACDLFVLPSVLKTEAFGIVQIEAMSCGKPVVATRIPGSGVSWVNEDGVSGKNALPKDPESLAAAIQEVLREKERYCEGAKRRYLQHFTKEQMIQKTINLYESYTYD